MDDKPELVYCSFNWSPFDKNVVQINWKNFFQLIDSLTKTDQGGDGDDPQAAAQLNKGKLTSLAILRRYLKMAFKFNFKNDELVQRCEHYLNKLEQLDLTNCDDECSSVNEEIKKIESEFSFVGGLQSQMNKRRTTTDSVSVFANDFPYFRLIKCILLENDLVKKNAVQLKALMSYCLDKCGQQFQVFADYAQSSRESDTQELLKMNDQ